MLNFSVKTLTSLPGRIILVSIAACLPFSLQAQSLAESQADFDLASGKLCFPVSLTDSNKLFDVCLQLNDDGPGYAFTVASASKRTQSLPGIAEYTQQGGLIIPVVKFSNGAVFADVGFQASLDSSTSEVVFTVSGGEQIALDSSQSIARIWNEV